jgi:hypothetical protein
MPPGSFGIFETFRILIPGYLFALYSSWYLTLFLPRAAGYLGDTKLATPTFFGVGLLAGLLLYQQKVPSDPREVTELLPSKMILQKAAQLTIQMTVPDATNLYFYLLNNYFPDPMRERIYFYGNIYRVAQKTWLISISFGVIAFLNALLQFVCTRRVPYGEAKTIYFLILIAVFVIAHRSAAGRYMEILYGQRKWLDMRKTLVESLIRDGYDSHATP